MLDLHRYRLCLPVLPVLLSLAVACGDNSEPPIAAGIFADLGEPLPSASPAERVIFESGLVAARRRFSPEEGFGDRFNVTFCVACHEKPVFGGGGGRYRNFLLVGQELSDGSFTPTGTNGVQAQYSVTDGRTPTDADTNVIATRNPIPFFGVGLLAEISDEEILSREDPDDVDGDGISGRVNFDRGFVGRFGRKAQNVAIESFIRGPLFNHLGITTNPLSPERRALLPVAGADGLATGSRVIEPPDGRGDVGTRVQYQVGAPDEPLEDDDGVPDPELSEDDLFEIVAFSMLMAAPRPDEPTPLTTHGREVFDEINCSGCHVESLLGPRGRIPAYTDLLLHDMGPDLADGILMGEATGSEFRTAPLWGITAVAPYLHDGRADTIDEAILLHAGEAQGSRDAYEGLAQGDRDALLAFLDSLGGASQRTDGLVVPGAEILPVGEIGGPRVALAGADADRFVQGRAIFDRDSTIGGNGLGPLFNGDACRACHFDPVIGGSGPADVDVIRHGIVDFQAGTFTPPAMGTMAHRFTTSVDERPPIDETANVIVRMQTPSIFGLGLVDQIPEANIIANADENDANGDGISGRPHILADGRVGRLGWRANVPSLAEFSRDALGAELGLTVPDQAGLTFGAATDEDAVPDPEISVAEIEALTFFMSTLAAPRRAEEPSPLEIVGEAAFDAVGCTSCHMPSLEAADGSDVPLFSDLLLHDVSTPGAPDIATGDAQMNEFRTPPLWGVRLTAPYMHNGAASTIEIAIIMHDGEARDVRDAYLALPPSTQRALVVFLRSL